MKRSFPLLLSASIAMGACIPASGQDGFSGGAYQSAPPQQWQPLAPQQGYQMPPQGYGQPPQQQGQPDYQQGMQQQQMQQGAAPGQPGTMYGYASQQGYQGQPGMNGQYQQPPPGYGQAPLQQPPPYGQPGMQQQQMQQPPQNGQAPIYGGTDTGATLDDDEPHQDKYAGIKKVGKVVAGVGAGVAGMYLMNKAMNRMSPMGGMQQQGYNPYYGGGYPPPSPYGYPYSPVPSYGGMGMPYGGGYPPMGGNPLMNMFMH